MHRSFHLFLGQIWQPNFEIYIFIVIRTVMKNPHFTNETNVIIVTVEIILLGMSEKKSSLQKTKKKISFHMMHKVEW